MKLYTIDSTICAIPKQSTDWAIPDQSTTHTWKFRNAYHRWSHDQTPANSNPFAFDSSLHHNTAIRYPFNINPMLSSIFFIGLPCFCYEKQLLRKWLFSTIFCGLWAFSPKCFGCLATDTQLRILPFVVPPGLRNMWWKPSKKYFSVFGFPVASLSLFNST